MGLINIQIPTQGYELVRDQVGAVLFLELQNQFGNYSDDDLDCPVSIERSSPIDLTELSTINVSFAQDEFDGKNQGYVNGTATYNVDVYTNAKTTQLRAGEEIASLRAQKIVGVCRAILENSIYRTLGFQAPFILRTKVAKIQMAETGKEDARGTAMARLTFEVVMSETTPFKTPVLIDENWTTVKLELTNKGYFYKMVNY